MPGLIHDVAFVSGPDDGKQLEVDRKQENRPDRHEKRWNGDGTDRDDPG